MTLEGVTWAHWEVDGSSFGEVESSWRGDLDDPQPDRDLDEHFVQPPADAYKAVIETDGMKYHLRASKVNEWELYPHAETDRLDVLYRHLSREPDEKDANRPAFTIQASHVMAVIDDHEKIQADRERSRKRSASEEAHAIAAKIQRLKKKARHV